MPRQSRGPASSAPRRPVAAPPAPAARPTPPQTRPASTAAHPPAQAPPQPQAQQSGGSGLFGQMASTAAGVAVGSSIGHAIGGFFGGGSSAAAPAAPADQPVAPTQDGQYAMNQNYEAPAVCATEVKGFRQCMDQNGGDLTICGWYLDQLKGCQQAASRY